MTKTTTTIYYDTKDQANQGWAYRSHARSGAIDGCRACLALHGIADGDEVDPHCIEALREEVLYVAADLRHVRLELDGGQHVDLSALLRLDEIVDAADALAAAHAESPEVRASGGPYASDADDFERRTLAQALQDSGVQSGPAYTDALRRQLWISLRDLADRRRLTGNDRQGRTDQTT